MKEIVFLGAAEEVTGSRSILTTNNGTRFGVDRGMVQGPNQKENDKRNLSSNDSNEPDLTIFSHAHLDHVGLAHQLRGPAVATTATKTLMAANLRNAESISPYLYPKGSVLKMLREIQCIDYNIPFRVDGSTVTLSNNGHILGSGSVIVEEKGGDRVIFSGDVGPRHSRTVPPATPIKGGANIAVIEGTYGDENRPAEDSAEVFEDAINRAWKNHGTVLIASFAVDRLQSALSIIKELKIKKRIPDMPFYSDAPLGNAITRIYMNYHSLLRAELREQKYPFNFPKLIITKNWRDSEKIHYYHKPKGIIAGGGNLTGGRMPKHALEYLWNPKNVFMIIGYPAAGTPSRAIADGEKEVQIGNESVTVGAKIIVTSSLSSHADQQGLFNWVKQIKDGNRRLRTVFINHCEKEKGKALADLIRTELETDVIIPERGRAYSLHSNNQSL